jgi:hypothetical protein
MFAYEINKDILIISMLSIAVEKVEGDDESMGEGL